MVSEKSLGGTGINLNGIINLYACHFRSETEPSCSRKYVYTISHLLFIFI